MGGGLGKKSGGGWSEGRSGHSVDEGLEEESRAPSVLNVLKISAEAVDAAALFASAFLL